MKKYFHSTVLAFLITSQIFLPVAIPATLGYQIDLLLSQVRTASGGVLAGGHVHFYAAGGTTPKAVYTDVNKSVTAANPYQLTANGTALLYGDGLYRIVIHTSTDVAAYDFDNVRYEDIGGLVTRITGLTGDNTGRIQGYSFGSASYTDNGYFNDVITKGPWVDVRAHIPVAYHAGIAAGTDNTNLSTYLQAASDNVGQGTLYWPKGVYHGKVYMAQATGFHQRWIGAGIGTTLTNNIDTDPAVKLYMSDWGYGLDMENMRVVGCLGDGISIQGQGGARLKRVVSLSNAGYGLRLGGEAHTTHVSVEDSIIQSNTLGGIYGKAALGTTWQLNVVNITRSQISDNHGHGIDLLGTVINITNNTIEGNDNAGIFMGGDATSALSNDIDLMNITGNYFEVNHGGDIRGIAEYDAGTAPDTVHYFSNVTIEGNRFYNGEDTMTGGISALMDFNNIGTGDGYISFIIGPNAYRDASTNDNTAFVNLHTSMDKRDRLYHSYVYGTGTNFDKRFKNIAGATVYSDGWLEGTGVPAVTPDHIGQLFYDTTGDVFYKASNRVDNTAWQVLTCPYLSYESSTPTTEVPSCVGQMWYVTTTKKIYKAACMTDNTCWQLLN